MSHTVHDLIARGDARVVVQPAAALARHQVEADRNFGLPTALYVASAVCYLGFLLVVGTAFANPALVIPLVIIGVFLVMFFAVPAAWARLRDNPSEPQTLGEFQARGIMTYTGRLNASDATIQVLILPVLLVVWGIAVAVIAAIVG